MPEESIESVLQLADLTCILGSQARTNLASKVLRFLELSLLAGEATGPTFSKCSSLTVA